MLALDLPSTSPPATAAGAAAQASSQGLRSLARAAQHDILRRLAPPLRHDMVVHLQSLGMMAEALGARMERGAAATEDLQGGVSKLNRLARNAVTRCLDVCSWMQPAEDDSAALADVAAEIVRLLSTSLNFRGFELRLEAGTGDGDLHVSRSAARFLLAGAILSLVDSVRTPGEITVSMEVSSSHGVVALQWQPQAEGSFTQQHDAGEAPLQWPELQALALQHGVELLRNDDSIVLCLPRALVTTPLTMAPV